jgi:pimeloyl-ACP methyl ester carboxylesterase
MIAPCHNARMIEEFHIASRSGEQLACSFYPPHAPQQQQPPQEPWPVAVLFHGFASVRHNEINMALVPMLTELGIAVMLADLAGHGQSSGSLGERTLPQATSEIVDVVEHVANDERVDANRVALLGNSASGGGAVLAAEHLDIVVLALKSPAFDYEFIRRRQLGDEGMARWERDGMIEVPPGIKVDWSTIEAARTVDVFDVFDRLSVPVKVWQGTNDDVIPSQLWERLESQCNVPGKTFVRVEGADHRLSGEHLQPFLDDVTEFFRTALLADHAISTSSSSSSEK